MKFEITLKQWLLELDDEIDIVHSDEINREAQENMMSFGVPDGSMDTLSPEAVRNFISGCSSAFAKNNSDIPMSFYCWYEELALQIRVGCVSKHHGKLPFRCAVEICSIEELASNIKAGISGLFTDKEELFVWQVSI